MILSLFAPLHFQHKLYTCGESGPGSGHFQVPRLRGAPQAQRRTPGQGLFDHLWAGQPKLFHGKVLLCQDEKGVLIMTVYKEKSPTSSRLSTATPTGMVNASKPRSGLQAPTEGTGLGARTAQQDHRRFSHDLQEPCGPLHSGYENPAEGKHLGHQRLHHPRQATALLRQVDNMQHHRLANHHLAGRDALPQGQERAALFICVS